MNLSGKTDKELAQWIRNHETSKRTETLLYFELLEEQARRTGQKQDLKLDRSMQHLEATAIQQVCTTYGALAKASDLDWSRARRQMDGPNGHLNRLSELCHARRLPFFTALCVSQDDVAAGILRGVALSGFIACAKRLGYTVGEEEAFHAERRDECWAWGRKQTRK